MNLCGICSNGDKFSLLFSHSIRTQIEFFQLIEGRAGAFAIFLESVIHVPSLPCCSSRFEHFPALKQSSQHGTNMLACLFRFEI